MPRLTPHRRHATAPLVFPCLLLAASLIGCSSLYRRLGGPFVELPDRVYAAGALSEGALRMIDAAFSDFTSGEVMADYHVHFFGTGSPEPYVYNAPLESVPEGDRPRLNEDEFREAQPLLQRPLAVGTLYAMSDAERATVDDDSARRLVELIAAYGAPRYAGAPEASPHRTDFHLLAMDGKYDRDGRLADSSVLVLSNEYVIALVEELNRKLQARGGYTRNRFVPVGSINPMRRDWREQIRLLREHGIKWIKWRVPTMDFDPAEVSAEFYQSLVEAGIGILSHTGESRGLRMSVVDNARAAPLRLTKALDLGVTVVMLHIGRASPKNAPFLYYDQFVSMLENPKYEGRLYGEISAVPYEGTQHLLDRAVGLPPERMVNGSDYPAVVPYVFLDGTLKGLVKRGWLTKDQAEFLDEIYLYHPILFDFVMKRTLAKAEKRIPRDFFLSLP